jgi:hypothetical protein
MAVKSKAKVKARGNRPAVQVAGPASPGAAATPRFAVPGGPAQLARGRESSESPLVRKSLKRRAEVGGVDGSSVRPRLAKPIGHARGEGVRPSESSPSDASSLSSSVAPEA